MSACETTKTVIRYKPIPPKSTIDCEKPVLGGTTYADLAEAYVARGEAIDVCNLQLKEIRELQEFDKD